MNLEGRLQRLRRTVLPPGPTSRVDRGARGALRGQLAPYAPAVFAEVSERCYDGLPFGEVGERAPLRGYAGAPTHVDPPPLPAPHAAGSGLKLVCYKPLFSGPAVERVSELQFQRPQAEVTLARPMRCARRPRTATR